MHSAGLTVSARLDRAEVSPLLSWVPAHCSVPELVERTSGSEASWEPSTAAGYSPATNWPPDVARLTRRSPTCSPVAWLNRLPLTCQLPFQVPFEKEPGFWHPAPLWEK